MNSTSANRAAINQAATNQANARRSTGPKAAAGKTKSSLNAVKTALTGRTVLLPSANEEAYRQHVNAYVDQFRPVGILESTLVQSLADHARRLDRLVALEMNFYAIGHATFALKADEHPSLLQHRAHLNYEKQLRNLHIQEARLRRYRAQEMAELKELQQNRRAQEAQTEEKASEEPAAALHLAVVSQGKAVDRAAGGFEFSTAQKALLANPRQPANLRSKNISPK